MGESPLTVPENSDCVDVENGAVVSHSWSCRSCLEFTVDFTLTDDHLAAVIAPNNMYLELWFDHEVTEQNVWYPIEVIETASATHGLEFWFKPSHVWPQNHVRFTGQLRPTQVAGAPPVIATRLCPIDSSLTTASTAITTAPATTTAPVTTTPVTTSETSEAVTTTEAADVTTETTTLMTMPVDENGCLEYANGATVKNDWACRNCLQLFVDLVISEADLATIGELENMYVEVWFDSVEVATQLDSYPVASSESASSTNGIKHNFEAAHLWPETGVIQFNNQLKFTGSNPTVSGVRVCPINSVVTTAPGETTTGSVETTTASGQTTTGELLTTTVAALSTTASSETTTTESAVTTDSSSTTEAPVE